MLVVVVLLLWCGGHGCSWCSGLVVVALVVLVVVCLGVLTCGTPSLSA